MSMYMKKIIPQILFSAVLLVGMSSCLKSSFEEDPVLGGKQIYNYAANQNTMSLDAVSAAFRLNIILTEAKSAGVTDLDGLKELTLTLSENTKINLWNRLLGSSVTIESPSAGVYELDFSDTSFSYGNREGTIRISTGGKLLDELGDSDGWNISFKEGEPFEYYTTSETLRVENGNFAIFKRSDRSWQISVMEYAARYVYSSANEGVLSAWDGDFVVSQSGGSSFTYDDCNKSEFLLWGFSAGSTYFRGAGMTYQIEEDTPLCYSLPCGQVTSGKVKAAFDFNVAIDTETYPSREVEVEWQKGAGSCTVSVCVYYNGLSQVQ